MSPLKPADRESASPSLALELATFLPLLRLLADGQWHSGAELGRALGGIGRAAIWKQIRRLNELSGIEIQARKGKGYRLREPIELLDAQAIRARLGAKQAVQLHILPSVASTNDYLKSIIGDDALMPQACLTEYQHAGRGRRGRHWQATPMRNITLSLAWHFTLPMRELSGLSIAVGASVAQLLWDEGLRGHGLKWPNDVHGAGGKKLAGILVELQGEMDGPCVAIIGLGLNLRLGAEGRNIDQPWTDLAKEMARVPSRNALAGALLLALQRTCQQYAEQGLKPFLPLWRRFDAYVGRSVRLWMGEQCLSGRYLGVAEDGGLCLHTSTGQRVFYAGEVSLRGLEE